MQISPTGTNMLFPFRHQNFSQSGEFADGSNQTHPRSGGEKLLELASAEYSDFDFCQLPGPASMDPIANLELARARQLFYRIIDFFFFFAWRNQPKIQVQLLFHPEFLRGLLAPGSGLRVKRTVEGLICTC